MLVFNSKLVDMDLKKKIIVIMKVLVLLPITGNEYIICTSSYPRQFVRNYFSTMHFYSAFSTAYFQLCM